MYLSNLRQDDLFVSSELRSLNEVTGLPTRKGLENVLISNGKIVNVVSSRYGHIPNEIFFKEAIEQLKQSGLSFITQSINRNDRSFSMDFIIDDKNQFSVKSSKDKILPMLRFTNSYDGSEKTSGHFGFFREICSNGLHIANSQIEFSLRHTTNGFKLYLPKLRALFQKFLENKYYSILTDFRKLEEFKIVDNREFVREIAAKTGIFKFECSDKNPEPSKNARLVLENLESESTLLQQDANLWLGYNALNAVLHRNMKKSFNQQKLWDKKIFDSIYELV
jgi:hypothetical protein